MSDELQSTHHGLLKKKLKSQKNIFLKKIESPWVAQTLFFQMHTHTQVPVTFP